MEKLRRLPLDKSFRWAYLCKRLHGLGVQTVSRKNAQTIDDIARLAGVSKSTVSRALNDSPLISRETKEKVREIAKEHNFQINASARCLSLRQSRTIAFVTHAYLDELTVADLFGLELMGGISRGLSERGYDMLVVHINARNTDWARFYLASGRVDGFITMFSSRKQQQLESLLAIDAPFITWGVAMPGRPHCSVGGDNYTGGRLAVEHLVAKGRRRIAFLGGPEDELEMQHRYNGYEAGLRMAGLPVDPTIITHTDFCTGDDSGERMAALLDRAPNIDAVVTNADLSAIAAIGTLRERGLRVPEDVAVVGYDDLSIAPITNPPLTTIRQDVPQAGKLLAHNLIQFLQTGIVTNVTMPVRLVIRQSA